MCKKMNFSLHDDFTTRLETLLIAHGVDDFTAADSSVPLSTSQAEVIEIEEPMTVTTLIPEFMPPQVESHEEPNVAMEGIRKKKRRREKEERKKKRKAKEARLERILSSSDRGKEGKDQCEEVLSRR